MALFKKRPREVQATIHIYMGDERLEVKGESTAKLILVEFSDYQ